MSLVTALAQCFKCRSGKALAFRLVHVPRVAADEGFVNLDFALKASLLIGFIDGITVCPLGCVRRST
jgi:hypothetical protein